VVEALAGQIVSGGMAVGASLPPEPVLCESFGVSRSVIRESLKVLEEKGLVAVRQGYGTTVLGPDQWDLLDPLVLKAVIDSDSTLAIFDDLVEVRCALEKEIARRATTTLTAAQLDELGALLFNLESLIDDPSGYTRADLEFHDAIAIFSGNKLARSVLRSVQAFGLASHYYRDTHRTRADNVFSHRGHVAIYGHLRRRDPDGAARATEEHILASWKRHKKRVVTSRAAQA
jgi:DNA-binding FadR family transcriptional regulator